MQPPRVPREPIFNTDPKRQSATAVMVFLLILAVLCSGTIIAAAVILK